MGVGNSPTANPEDAPALLDISPCTSPRKECSCLPVPPSSRLCHAQGDIYMDLARKIPELPPCHTPGLRDRVKHPTLSGLEVSNPPSQLSFHIREAHIVLLSKAGVWCLCLRRFFTSEEERPTPSTFFTASHRSRVSIHMSETSTVDIPWRTEPCRPPLRHSAAAAGFPSLGILPGSPKHLAVLPKPPHLCYGDRKYRWFWEPNCHKGFLCLRIPPHNWVSCSPSSCLPCASPLLSKDGAK